MALYGGPGWWTSWVTTTRATAWLRSTKWRTSCELSSAPTARALTSEIHPLVARWPRQRGRLALPSGPLFDLVQANRQDQNVPVTKASRTSSAIAGCRPTRSGGRCSRSSGYATPERLAWSDSICTGLQLVEHWQDVAEDAIVGRVYLPMDDMRRFGVTVEELVPRRPITSTAGGRALPAELRRVPGVARVRGCPGCEVLDEGTPLIASLDGRLGSP